MRKERWDNKTMLEAMLLNAVKSLIASELQSLGQEHVDEALKNNLSDEQMEMLDKVVDAMPDNTFTTIKEFFT